MRIIIAGAFAIGSYLAKLLSRNKQEVVLMDQDEEKLGKLAIDYDLLTMHASATSIRSLKEARVEDTDLFIAVTPDESYNMTACGLAKALGAKKTVAKIDSSEYVDPQNKELFHEMGISSIIYPEMLAAPRHHQRSENVVGAAAMGCPRRCVGDAGHQAPRDLQGARQAAP